MNSRSNVSRTVTIGPRAGQLYRAWSPSKAIAIGYRYLSDEIMMRDDKIFQRLGQFVSGKTGTAVPRLVKNVDGLVVNLFEQLFTWDTVSVRVRELTKLRLRRVIDVGCGSGMYAISLACRGSTVTCNDPNPVCLEFIKYAAKELRLRLHEHPARAPFDAALCINVLDHTKRAPQLVEKIADSLKPGGCLLIHADFVCDGRHISDIPSIERVLHKLTQRFVRDRRPSSMRAEFWYRRARRAAGTELVNSIQTKHSELLRWRPLLHPNATGRCGSSGDVTLQGFPFYLMPTLLNERAWRLLLKCDGSRTIKEILAASARDSSLSPDDALGVLREMFSRHYLSRSPLDKGHRS
ncbi:MAG: class I SAM-dependent methyltransferase [Bradyrhizobium sp.]|uniref:class I SAM-dependent methyltransferase n=1 Tax=Bradyrhizobium sp. TaxID=376 RepID=UPI0012081AEF|nr:MAG: class I SAM-dependent methyltransferase [Bradyrhizobium sp.]